TLTWHVVRRSACVRRSNMVWGVKVCPQSRSASAMLSGKKVTIWNACWAGSIAHFAKPRNKAETRSCRPLEKCCAQDFQWKTNLGMMKLDGKLGEISLLQSNTLADEPIAPDLAARFLSTRALSEALAAPLSEADATLQSMEDASPVKWHLAHMTWFWETFLLRDHKPGYSLHDERWPFLFNSYYEAEGARHSRARRGLLSRPAMDEIIEWRAHVDREMEPLLSDEALAPLIELGIAHEQQHQELLLTDIKHALSTNPLGPAMWEGAAQAAVAPIAGWHEY